jgi:hypothetical protein
MSDTMEEAPAEVSQVICLMGVISAFYPVFIGAVIFYCIVHAAVSSFVLYENFKALYESRTRKRIT